MADPKKQDAAPPAAAAARRGKPGDLDDAHFRIDEMERRMSAVPSSDHIAGIASGVAHTTGQAVLQEVRKLRESQEEDVKTDLEVVQGLRDLITELQGMSRLLREVLSKVASARRPD